MLAPLSDPGETIASDLLDALVLPTASGTAPALTIGLSELNHAARMSPVYASQLQSPASTQHSVPGGGQPYPGETPTH
jgi:hypothetical protein